MESTHETRSTVEFLLGGSPLWPDANRVPSLPLIRTLIDNGTLSLESCKDALPVYAFVLKLFIASIKSLLHNPTNTAVAFSRLEDFFIKDEGAFLRTAIFECLREEEIVPNSRFLTSREDVFAYQRLIYLLDSLRHFFSQDIDAFIRGCQDYVLTIISTVRDVIGCTEDIQAAWSELFASIPENERGSIPPPPGIETTRLHQMDGETGRIISPDGRWVEYSILEDGGIHWPDSPYFAFRAKMEKQITTELQTPEIQKLIASLEELAGRILIREMGYDEKNRGDQSSLVEYERGIIVVPREGTGGFDVVRVMADVQQRLLGSKFVVVRFGREGEQPLEIRFLRTTIEHATQVPLEDCKFVGAGRVSLNNCAWGSFTCKDAYGFDQPLDPSEASRILQIVEEAFRRSLPS